MKKYFKIVFVVVALIASVEVFAQQITLSTNYIMNAYAYNPAVSGSVPFTKVNVFYRNQWTGFEGAPKTLLFSVDASNKLLGFESGVGLNVVSDELGFQKNIAVKLDYAYRRMTKFGKRLPHRV